MTIVMTERVNDFFGDAVGSALSAQRVDASCEAKAYLVGVLVDFAQRGQTAPSLEAPLTFLLRDAMLAPALDRLEKLKDVGDGTLYVSGFFPDHLDAKGVDAAYVARMGATAYGAAASLLQSGDGPGLNLFGELSAKFEHFVRVLQEIADAFFARAAQDPRGIVKVYERWQKTGSARLGQELFARGLVPMKPSGGLQ